MGEILFVTGGARSGKSRYAEGLAVAAGGPVVYLATLEPLDGEMRHRIARHRADRPGDWATIEEPRDIVAPLESIDGDTTVLLDCLSLWVSNRLLELGETPSAAAGEELDAALDAELGALLEHAAAREGALILVSNEVGSGVVPPTVLGRAYRDALGRVNQRAAAAASRAWLLVAGRALELPRAN